MTYQNKNLYHTLAHHIQKHLHLMRAQATGDRPFPHNGHNHNAV